MTTPLVKRTRITNKHEYRRAIVGVLTHPHVVGGKWFGSIIDDGTVDERLNELWATLAKEMDVSPDESFTVADLDVDLSEIVHELVWYCNDSWNFPPGGAPQRMSASEVMQSVAKVLSFR